MGCVGLENKTKQQRIAFYCCCGSAARGECMCLVFLSFHGDHDRGNRQTHTKRTNQCRHEWQQQHWCAFYTLVPKQTHHSNVHATHHKKHWSTITLYHQSNAWAQQINQAMKLYTCIWCTLIDFASRKRFPWKILGFHHTPVPLIVVAQSTWMRFIPLWFHMLVSLIFRLEVVLSSFQTPKEGRSKKKRDKSSISLLFVIGRHNIATTLQ